jgi:hypothetical protein
MNSRSVFTALATCMICISSAFANPLEATRLSVLYQEQGRDVSIWTRFAFSRTQDLALNFQRKSTENSVINSYETRLIPRSTRFDPSSLSGGELIHSNGDDSTPWNINGTYIGGNHGCLSLIQLSVPEKAITVADIGSSWKDESGAIFYLIDVPAAGSAHFLSENLASYPFWNFHDRITGSTLTRVGSEATLAVADARLTQLWPCARIREQKFLADGKTPLAPGKPIECRFLDLVEEYDIINPASVLAEVVKNPGKRPDLTGPHLDGVIRNRIIYRISPNASVVTFHQATALQPFRLGFMGFIQQALLQKPANSSEQIRYYIPKAPAFEQDETAYDFRLIQEFDKPPQSPLRFTGTDEGGRRELPERFVQFLGSPDSPKNKNRVGLAVGYSLTKGLTAVNNANWNRRNAGFIHTSAKTYPFALDETVPNPVPEGSVFECVAYRQYFNPELQDQATSVYWHAESEETTVYIDYHQQATNDRIRLPISLAGKKFRVLEKSDSITFPPTETLPSDGLPVSCSADHGFLVIAVDTKSP